MNASYAERDKADRRTMRAAFLMARDMTSKARTFRDAGLSAHVSIWVQAAMQARKLAHAAIRDMQARA